jgi:hypothetical protein
MMEDGERAPKSGSTSEGARSPVDKTASQAARPSNALRVLASLGFVTLWIAVIYFCATAGSAWFSVPCVFAAFGCSILLYGLIVHRAMNVFVPVLPMLALALVYYQTKATAVLVISVFLGLYLIAS